MDINTADKAAKETNYPIQNTTKLLGGLEDPNDWGNGKPLLVSYPTSIPI